MTAPLGVEAQAARSSNPNSDSRTWTAARCHRLLRPIQSRIELLRRVSSLKSCAQPFGNDHDKHRHFEPSQELLLAAEDSRDSTVSDEEWKPYAKRQRRTYSGKTRALLIAESSVKDLRQCHKTGFKTAFPFDGGFNNTCILTPLPWRSSTADNGCDAEWLNVPIQKKRTKDLTYQDASIYNISGRIQDENAVGDVVDQLRQTIDPGQLSLCLGLLNALRVLLVATRPKDRPLLLKDRSLMSMVLRAIPQQIHEEERLAKGRLLKNSVVLSPDPPDAVSKMYSELEQYGHSGRDWKYLQIVVRADGLRRICTAIKDGHLDAASVRVLLDLCARSGSIREAEVILAAFMRDAEFPAPYDRSTSPSGDLRMLHISILEECLIHQHFQDVYLRQLRHLFSTKALPITWAATSHFDLMWTELFKGLTLRSSAESNALLTLLLSMIFRQVIDHDTDSTDLASEKTLQNSFAQKSFTRKSFTQLYEIVLRTLLTIVMLELNQPKLSASNTTGRRVVNFVRQALLRQYLDGDTMGTTSENSASSILLVSIVLLDCFENGPSNTKHDELLDVLSTLNRDSCDSKHFASTLGALSAFVCSVAHSCGKVDASGGLQYLEIMLGQLSTLASSQICRAELTFIRNLVTDCAYLFAEQQPSIRSLAFAENVGLKAGPFFGRVEASPSARFKNPTDSYRWEDGINEWVAVTPRISSFVSAARETGCEVRHLSETPIKDVLSRHSHRTSLHLSDTGLSSFPNAIIKDDTADCLPQLRGTAIVIDASMSASSRQGLYREHSELSRSKPATLAISNLIDSVLGRKTETALIEQGQHDDSGDELDFLGSIRCYGTTTGRDVRKASTRRHRSYHSLDAWRHPQDGVLSTLVEHSEDELGV